MNKKNSLVVIVVCLAGIAGMFLLAGQLSAAPPPVSALTVQAGTAVIDTGGDADGFVNIYYDFPGTPVLVVSQDTEFNTRQLTGRALSSVTGTIIVELERPTDQPVIIKWVATMATETAVEGGR